MAFTGKRIVVLGNSGSGKTTLAQAISGRLGCPHTELDALHWEEGWKEAPIDLFRERVQRVISGESWVIDGNYAKVRPMIWAAADTVIWLDYPLPLILWRLLRRSLRRTLLREELWNGNRETIRGQFFSRESLFLWVLKSHGRKRREYPVMFARPENAHLTFLRFNSPRQVEQWLKEISE